MAQWLLREIPEATVVPCGTTTEGLSRYHLPDGSGLSCVSAVQDRKQLIFDGEVIAVVPTSDT